jgi:chlorite dismutase
MSDAPTNDLPPLTLAWTDEAVEALRRAPAFVRRSVVRNVEAYAMLKGINEVTPATMAEAKEAREKAGTEAEHAPGQGGQFPTPENDESAPKRQYVTFFFLKIDPAWRRLPESERSAHKAAFAEVWAKWAKGGEVICRSYSTVGVRSDVDLMLWRVSYKLDLMQDMTAELLKTPLGGYLTPAAHLVGMTKRSVYEDKLNPNHEDARLKIVPGRARYIFVYPFVKTRDWYLSSVEERQQMMDEHITVGSKYSRVKLNTTYSFGLDDQDFVVAFESNYPEDFLDLVQELRETKASKHTVRDTPTYTCIARPITEALDLLG